MGRSERWFVVKACAGSTVLAEVIVCGFADAQADARVLRAKYPQAVVTVTRDA